MSKGDKLCYKTIYCYLPWTKYHNTCSTKITPNLSSK